MYDTCTIRIMLYVYVRAAGARAARTYVRRSMHLHACSHMHHVHVFYIIIVVHAHTQQNVLDAHVRVWKYATCGYAHTRNCTNVFNMINVNKIKYEKLYASKNAPISTCYWLTPQPAMWDDLWTSYSSTFAVYAGVETFQKHFTTHLMWIRLGLGVEIFFKATNCHIKMENREKSRSRETICAPVTKKLKSCVSIQGIMCSSVA